MRLQFDTVASWEFLLLAVLCAILVYWLLSAVVGAIEGFISGIMIVRRYRRCRHGRRMELRKQCWEEVERINYLFPYEL